MAHEATSKHTDTQLCEDFPTLIITIMKMNRAYN